MSDSVYTLQVPARKERRGSHLLATANCVRETKVSSPWTAMRPVWGEDGRWGWEFAPIFTLPSIPFPSLAVKPGTGGQGRGGKVSPYRVNDHPCSGKLTLSPQTTNIGERLD